MTAKKTIEDKILDKIDFCGDDECWLWTGATLPYGPSGVVFHKGKLLYAHRLAFKILGGKKLSSHRGKCVLHRCGNKLCCNPKHLFVGSLSDAHALVGVSKKHKDMRKGRHKLTKQQRARIKQRILRGDTPAAIQRDYTTVHYSTVLKYARELL